MITYTHPLANNMMTDHSKKYRISSNPSFLYLESYKFWKKLVISGNEIED